MFHFQVTTESSKRKRQRGKKKRIEGRYIVTELDDEGGPTVPNNVQTKLVNQIGFLVRDRIPISYQNWKAPDVNETDPPSTSTSTPASSTSLSVVPKTEKEMLWDDILENFNFDQVDVRKVKDWCMRKAAIAFQSYKKRLNRDFIKKGLTPDFNKHQNLRDHWDSFVQYKESRDSQKSTVTNTGNAKQKKYFHRLGPGAYKKGMIKRQRMKMNSLLRG